METTRGIASTNYDLIDTYVTNIHTKHGEENSPFEFAMESSIKNRVDEEVKETSEATPLSKQNLEDFEKAITLKQYETKYTEQNIRYLRNNSVTLQSWKGIIVELKDDCFIAELQDLTNGGTNEIVEIELLSVSPDDLNLVSVGASFYWSIGYKMNYGQITKESIIRFQRLIEWDSDDYDQATDRASNLLSKLIIE
ncbi:MAG: hypothetical protein ACOCWM_04440 [Cyclobacteriaceae bacterium]